MANDCIRRPDAQFHARQNSFVTCVNGHLADLGLAPGDVIGLNNSAATRTTDYPAHTAAQCHAFTGRAPVGMSSPMSTCLRATVSHESMAPGTHSAWSAK